MHRPHIDHILGIRSQKWRAALAVLSKAEAGDVSAGILSLRKTFQDFIRFYLLDIGAGIKNPVRRLEKIFKDADSGEYPKDLYQKAQTALETYNGHCETMRKASLEVSEFTVTNIQSKINQIRLASGDVESSHAIVDNMAKAMGAHIAEVRKAKQAEGRAARTSAQRWLKVFEATKLPPAWRAELLHQGLAVDPDEDIDENTFSKFKPSKPAEGEFKSSSWSEPRMYLASDEGHRRNTIAQATSICLSYCADHMYTTYRPHIDHT